jgi:carbon-monoxide dehydrogenase large subunit
MSDTSETSLIRKPFIGRSVPRVEDFRFVTGGGNYTDDTHVEGELHCVFVRSPHSHARITSIETTAADAMPGVIAVLTGKDYAEDGCLPIDHVPNPADAIDVRQRAFTAQGGRPIREQKHWPLAIDFARYLGEPVVAVIAQTLAQAYDAAEAVEVHYEPLAVATSIAEAIREGAPQIWPDIPGNSCLTYDIGDAAAVDRAFSDAVHLVRHTFDTNRIVNCQLEPRAAIGTYNAASGDFCLISGNQGVTKLQMSIAPALGIDKSKLRVVCPDVGGGFGPRTYVYSEQVVVLWASRRTGRPVRWTSSRSEAFLTDYQGRDNLTHVTLALDKRGKALALRTEFYGAIGAQTVAYVTPANAMRMLTTVYRIPVAHGLIHAIVTNATPTAPYRGAGRPEANHFIERMFDLAAHELGMDRAEIRRRNLVGSADMPFRSAMGLTYDAGDFRGYMEQVLARADWTGFKTRRREAKKRGKLAGIGVANHIEGPVGAPVERVTVSILPSGKIDVIVGTQSSGQGHETSFAQVMADQFGTPMDQVAIRYGDSAFVTLGGGTHSDRSLRIAGTLIVQAAEEIRDKARAPAAALLQCAIEDLIFDDGLFRVGNSQRTVHIAEVARACASNDLPADLRQSLTATKDFFGRIPAFPGGSAVCEVEVDPASGEVQITRYATVDDVGLAVNPMIVEGQTHGGIVQGIGQALFEGVRFQDGQVLTGSFMDYGIARASDVPSFDARRAEDPTRLNPLRVKGAGEGGIAPVTAVVTSAICDALSEYGIRDLPMPITPASIWQALQKASAASPRK